MPYILDERQIYDRPKTIAGRKIRRITGALHSYSVGDTVETIFEGEWKLPNTQTQVVRLTHNACEGVAIQVTSGGSVAVSPAPVFNTYSTVFTVDPTATTITAKLTGYPVEIGARSFDKIYDDFGEVLEFNCAVASDPTLAGAMYDHFHGVETATAYEISLRDDPSIQPGDRIIARLAEGRAGAVTKDIPVVVTQIKRSFDGGCDATYRVVTEIGGEAP